jgi:excisionase family DNA binding protein
VSRPRGVGEVSFALSEQVVDAIAERAAELVLERIGEGNGASPWLSLAEAAKYLSVSARTLQRLASRGRIRSTTLGRRRLFHRDELDRLAAAGEGVAPTTPPHRRGK